jgi:hypothetical protein
MEVPQRQARGTQAATRPLFRGFRAVAEVVRLGLEEIQQRLEHKQRRTPGRVDQGVLPQSKASAIQFIFAREAEGAVRTRHITEIQGALAEPVLAA